MNFFPKGSEWRKWDLHVHTPASELENQFGDDWDVYVKNLFKSAIENNICAIGITDYYLPEGYRKLKQEYLNNPQKMSSLFTVEEILKINKIAVFANIEFRLAKLVIGKEPDLVWNRKLNYHVLLSDEIGIEKIYSEFVSLINISFNSSTGSQVEKRPLTRATLESLGERLISEHPPFANAGSSLRVGMLNAAVDEDEVIKILKNNSDLKGNFLLGLPADEDLSDVHWNSQGHAIRKNLIKQAHFIFSSNKGTIKFLLGGFDKEKQIKEFGCLKPCLWGSDAHGFEKLFSPDNNRHTWVKADLTFEGLKQVIYDPESRVRIQELSPQQKSSYQTIERVRFIDSSGRNFTNEWHFVSPDLTTIIGGKSSGKSLLLYHIAKAINAAEVSTKVELAKASSYKELLDVDFEVEWSDGSVSKLSEPADSKPITYIPQLYINHLAEEDGRDQLNMLVKSILTQNNGFKEFATQQERIIHDINIEISDRIVKIFDLRERFSVLATEIASFGNRKSVEEEVVKLTDLIKLLREKSGFSSEQEQQFLLLTSQVKTWEARKNSLEALSKCSIQVVESIKQRSNSLLLDFRDAIFSDVDLPQDSKFLKGLIASFEDVVMKGIGEFSEIVAQRANSIPVLSNKLQRKLGNNVIKLLPLMQKVKDQGELELANNKLKAEEAKLKSILEIEAKQAAIKVEGMQCRSELYEKLKLRTDKYKEYVLEVSKSEYQPEGGIRILAEVGFSESQFSEFSKCFDGRGNLTNFLGDLMDSNGGYTFDTDSYAESLISIDRKLRSPTETLSRRKGVSEQEATKRLFQDCLYISFVVRYRDDEIARMSPGKRGLVLLNLILHLSNASHPILIDQPEDNLDNRTIYDQLNVFIRERKSKRQIIMVTHNANLVVAADSECVIVANQAGQQANLENDKYRFEYCSGSLEFTYNDEARVGMLNKKGIRQHVCEILEGGIVAFKERELKYGFRA